MSKVTELVSGQERAALDLDLPSLEDSSQLVYDGCIPCFYRETKNEDEFATLWKCQTKLGLNPTYMLCDFNTSVLA